MRFTSGLSDAANPQEAVARACQQAKEQLAGEPCDLACVFASAVYRAADWASIVSRIANWLEPRVLIGSSGSGIIGGGRELEWIPAVSVVAASLPQVRLFPFIVTPEELERSAAGGFWIDKVGASPQARPIFIVLVDPYTCDPTKLLAELNSTYRACPVIGGLASGGSQPGEHVLLFNGTVHREGAVGVAMTGNITMETIIAQGCRPVGRPYVVTRAEDNVVWELGGRQALAVLHEVLSQLSAGERELAQRGSVFVGLAVTEMRQAFASGDFLIRHIIGLDPDAGALVVADEVTVGQTLQFQLRDPSASRQELRRRLLQGQPTQAGPPAGCLLFNCTGRGRSLYGIAHQDVKTIQMVSGKFPIGGFFCSGEIGPIGGVNFLHGYTASLGLFRPGDASPRALP
jgi:small ligand-binding sensory domain FIST